MGFATIAIHTGSEPDEATGSVTVPIYQTSTYAQDALGKNKGYEYARTQNPTRSAVERNIAALEGAKFGFAFASGMAAIDATLRLIKAGEHVVVSDNTYGGTARLFNRILSNYGIEFDYVDTSDPLNVEAAIKQNTKMVFLETPTNPIMTVTDLKEVSNEKNLPVKWSAEENVAWKVAMPGLSGSTPVIWRDRIFVSVAEADNLALWCIARNNGEVVWKQPLGAGAQRVEHRTVIRK
jgi:hypothetical protein